MPSFDIVLEPNLVELRNAVDQTQREIGTRFDFKGSPARVDTIDVGKDKQLHLYGDSDFQIAQVRDILLARLSKRSVDIRFLDLDEDLEKMGGDRLRQVVFVKSGIDAETAKKVQLLLRQSKLKVQSQYQGDAVRISGGKRDDLQAAIALVRREVTDLPLGFKNFRD